MAKKIQYIKTNKTTKVNEVKTIKRTRKVITVVVMCQHVVAVAGRRHLRCYISPARDATSPLDAVRPA